MEILIKVGFSKIRNLHGVNISMLYLKKYKSIYKFPYIIITDLLKNIHKNKKRNTISILLSVLILKNINYSINVESFE